MKTKVKAKFKGRLSMSPGLSPRLSPSKDMRIGLALGRCSKKYGAFTKCQRIEVSYECQVHNYLESPSCSLRLIILFLILTSCFYGPWSILFGVSNLRWARSFRVWIIHWRSWCADLSWSEVLGGPRRDYLGSDISMAPSPPNQLLLSLKTSEKEQLIIWKSL